jgi:hypothetical protein
VDFLFLMKYWQTICPHFSFSILQQWLAMIKINFQWDKLSGRIKFQSRSIALNWRIFLFIVVLDKLLSLLRSLTSFYKKAIDWITISFWKFLTGFLDIQLWEWTFCVIPSQYQITPFPITRYKIICQKIPKKFQRNPKKCSIRKLFKTNKTFQEKSCKPKYFENFMFENFRAK